MSLSSFFNETEYVKPLQYTKRTGRLNLFLLLVLYTLFLSSCDSGGAEQSADIAAYLRSLDYLEGINEQDNPGDFPIGETETEVVGGDFGEVTCERTPFNLSQNFDQITIMRPTQGIIWPGALVKANESLNDGLPEPFTLDRAPVTFSIDLPGIGENGIRTVPNPTQSSIQAAIDSSLEWWNANAYQEGYVNAASSFLEWTSSYSSKQTSLHTGFNLDWVSGEVMTAFNQNTSESNHVITGVFRQAFYTITFDTPSSPGAVFADHVSLDEIETTINRSAPPAYVANVTYGRLLTIQMSSSNSYSKEEIEAAFEYSAGLRSVSAELEVRYQQIVRESSFTAFAIGGNAAEALNINPQSAATFNGFLELVQGDNALYSRGNPGVPISYTIRYLRDNRLTRLGATTEYTASQCRLNADRVTLRYRGIQVIKDCRLFGGRFYWSLGGIGESGQQIVSTRDRDNAALGDDLVPTYIDISRQRTFTITKTPGAELIVNGWVRERENGNILVGSFEEVHPAANNWSPGNKSVLLDAGSQIASPCRVRVDYTVSVED